MVAFSLQISAAGVKLRSASFNVQMLTFPRKQKRKKRTPRYFPASKSPASAVLAGVRLPSLQLFSVIRRWPAGPSEVCVSVCVHASACLCGCVSGRTCRGVIKKVCGRGAGRIQQPAVLLHRLQPALTSGPTCHPSVICSIPTVGCVLTQFLFFFFFLPLLHLKSAA